MAIKFFNIKSKEVRVASTEPMIAALYNSSDLSPNAMQGQDFGWRLAPETVVEVDNIKKSPEVLNEIAIRYRLPLDNIRESNILKYIADRDARRKQATSSDNQDYSEEYQAEIRSLKGQAEPEQKLPEFSDDIEPQFLPETPTEEPAPEQPDLPEPVSDSLLNMTRKELVSMATELGIEKPDDIKGGKEKIVEAIRLAEANKS